MNATRIRPYHPKDLEGVLRIWEDASRVGHRFLPESFIASEREAVRDTYLPMASTWVHEENGEVTGFISLIDDEVGALFVDPKSHRRGIGRALLELAMDRHPRLDVEVFEPNTGARTFYETCGFVLIGEYLHSETGQTMVRMRSRVDGSKEFEGDD
jgi:putative acetyltransferase